MTCGTSIAQVGSNDDTPGDTIVAVMEKGECIGLLEGGALLEEADKNP